MAIRFCGEDMKNFLHVKKVELKIIIPIFLALAFFFGVCFLTACTGPTQGSTPPVTDSGQGNPEYGNPAIITLTEAEKEYNSIIANVRSAKSLTIECTIPGEPDFAEFEENKLKLVEDGVTTYYLTEQNENFEFTLQTDGWHKSAYNFDKIEDYKNTIFKRLDAIEWRSVNKDKLLSGKIKLGLTALSKVTIKATYDLAENSITYYAMDYTVKVYGINSTSVTLPTVIID